MSRSPDRLTSDESESADPSTCLIRLAELVTVASQGLFVGLGSCSSYQSRAARQALAVRRAMRATRCLSSLSWQTVERGGWKRRTSNWRGPPQVQRGGRSTLRGAPFDETPDCNAFGPSSCPWRKGRQQSRGEAMLTPAAAIPHDEALEVDVEADAERVVTLLELYSGMGTMRWSLEAALLASEAEKEEERRTAVRDRVEIAGAKKPSPPVIRSVGAVDNSDVANAVYAANYPEDPPPRRVNIEHLTLAQLDAMDAEVWMLSPPCQPYTRKGKELHGEDPRAGSFLHVLRLFPQLNSPPRRMLVENVVGFEKSATRDLLVATLEDAGYIWREFQLSPHHFGVPYTRERYYLLAKRKRRGDVFGVRNVTFRDAAAPAMATAGSDDYKSCSPQGKGGDAGGDATPCLSEDDHVHSGAHRQIRRTIGEYLEFIGGFGSSTHGGADTDAAGADCTAAGADADRLAELTVPRKVVDKYWKWLDVCSPSSTRCQCFTAGYGKTVYGGSVLASEDFVAAYCTPTDCATGRHRLLGPLPEPTGVPEEGYQLRYFSPREMASLHGLTKGFELPVTMLTRRQLYFTIGNSISVDVVTSLMSHLLED